MNKLKRERRTYAHEIEKMEEISLFHPMIEISIARMNPEIPNIYA